MPASTRTSPGTAMPASAWTCGAAASPRACSTTSTRAGARGPARSHRLDRAPALVHGNVGMTGISWGGFNSLQLAARRPPALKAVITLMSHRRPLRRRRPLQGRLRAGDRPAALEHAACSHWQCQPPHEAAVGERWRELWKQRLAANKPWVHTWLAHQRRDAYWKHGSVCEDYAAIEIPVYADRRLDRRLHQQRASPARGPAGPAQGPHRALAARVSALRHSGAGHRLPAGGPALVGPLAEGRGHGRDGRAHAPRLDAGPHAAGRRGWTRCRGGGRRRTCGRRRASSRGRCGWTPDLVLRDAAGGRGAGPRGGGRARRGRRPPQHPRRPALRRRRRRLVRREPAERLRARPARRGGPVAVLHLGAPARAAGDPRSPAAHAPLRERPAAGAGRRPAGRRRAGRRLEARHHAGLQPDPPDEPRDARAPGAGPGVHGDDRPGRDRPGLPGRPPPAARALADVLALGVALAGAGHAHGGRRREPAGAAGTAGAARGRGPPALRPARRARGPRREDARRRQGRPRLHARPRHRRASPGPSATSTAATSSSPTAGRARSGTR